MPNAWLDLPGFREAVVQVVSDSGNADDGWLDSAQAATYLGVTRPVSCRAGSSPRGRGR
jgi:hypothetical protein